MHKYFTLAIIGDSMLHMPHTMNTNKYITGTIILALSEVTANHVKRVYLYMKPAGFLSLGYIYY